MATQPSASESPYRPDELEQRLLNEMQRAFPLVARPFAELAERIGTTEDEVLSRVERLKTARIVRQISAIFDSRKLGYRTSLVAMRFEPEALDEGAGIISLHPGVSHNYERRHPFNLWFTIAVPPQREPEEEVAALARKAQPVKTWMLPTIKLFKIGVNLDATGQSDITAVEKDEENIGLRSARSWQSDPEIRRLDDDELVAIRLLQRDLPVVSEPFAALSEGSPINPSRLLALAQGLLAGGQLRRFAAVLHHRQAGFRANVMAVWVVPEARIDEVGGVMATFKAVSHCYKRPVYPDWPYSVFTMIHARHKDECEEVVAAISERTGITDYALLYSGKEYKKTRVRYFVDDDQFSVEALPERVVGPASQA